jgi:transcriptional regulator NrdR family protein
MNGTANESVYEKSGGVRCPKCGHRRSRGIYTRNVGGRVVRRRECHRRASRITTSEHIVSR